MKKVYKNKIVYGLKIYNVYVGNVKDKVNVKGYVGKYKNIYKKKG
jgi:hypothetical protein